MSNRSVVSIVAVFVGILVVAVPLTAQERVGTVTFPNSGSADAQEAFIYGVAQLHNFEYGAAASAFRRAQEIDPDFTLAYWGEAMTHNHPVWQQQDRDAAVEVLQRLGATPAARAAKAGTPVERDLLAALDVLYGEGPKEDRDDAYARFMEGLHAKYDDHTEIAAFTALAILGTAHEGRDFATYMRSAAIVETVFDNDPSHPGAAHYLIHSYDDPIHAPLGLRAARAYSAIAPDAGHAQHMVSHIFVASGMWEDVVEANINASAAVNRAVARFGREGPKCGHYITWLNYGYVQLDRRDEAGALIGECHAAAVAAGQEGPVFDPDNSQAGSFITMWARYLIDTEDWESDVAGLSVDLMPEQAQERMTIALIHGLASARSGNAAEVEQALEIIKEGRAVTDKLIAEGHENYSLAAAGRSEVMELQVSALLAQTTGNADKAVELAHEAAAREAQMPFMFGPPYVDKPSFELLGEILLAAGRNEAAAAAFREALARTPQRALSLQGLETALR